MSDSGIQLEVERLVDLVEDPLHGRLVLGTDDERRTVPRVGDAGVAERDADRVTLVLLPLVELVHQVFVGHGGDLIGVR